MNRNWRITTGSGHLAIKQIIDVPLPTARRNLRALTALAAHGIPACPPLQSVDGDPVIAIDDRGYCLLPWIHGTHPTGEDLTLDQARELGTTLGHIHRALQRDEPPTGLPAATTRPAARVIHPDTALAEANRYQTAARTAPSGPFDHQVIDLLDHRKTLIDKHSPAKPTDDDPRGPFGWTHGDLQYRNVIWRHGRIAAVIDWDRIRIRPYAEEIARTATIQFATNQRLDLPRVAAFVTGYRTIVPLDEAHLADGVHRLWWKRLSDFWHLDYHYDRGDHGCDGLFLTGEAFLDWWTHNRDDVQHAFAAQP
jgi:homoserine kinase type II